MTARLPCTVGRAVLAGLLAAGCYAYRAVPTTPVPTSAVRVVFKTAQVLTTIPLAPDTLPRIYAGVLEASGVIEAGAGDSLAIRLGELRGATGSVGDVDGQVVMIAAAQVERFEERRFQAGTTALAGFGAAALALTALLVVTIAAIVRSF
jgi:hypothetical protein